MAGLMDLDAKRASFLFATHFHEILKFSEMQEISRPDGGSVQIKHMAVHYDRELDRLVYDRVLRDGPGNRVYGLEVAKSLHLPQEFIETAYRIRQKYYPDTQGPLANTTTRYNSKKIRGLCEICKVEMAEETHHVMQQKDADERGFIEGTGVHKNHPANLMGLCSKCHDAQHRTEGKVAEPNPSKKNVIRKVVKKPDNKDI
jgi:DNA mismatch repair protein MutS